MGNIEKFDSMASFYDTSERIMISRIIADNIRKCIIDGKGKTAIDYGCGTGIVGMYLLGDFDKMIFIDASYKMIEEVKQKIDKLNIKNADAIFYDLTTDYPENLHSDYIIISQTLLHIKEIDLVLSRLYEVLNKDGHILIVDFNKDNEIISDEVHNGFDQKQLINTIEKLGFRNAKAKTFYHGEKMFMNRDASLFILDAVK